MKIKVLDCTLRDGAYVVNSNFDNVQNIIQALNSAKIDIIECGWLRNNLEGNVTYLTPNDYIFGIKNAALMFDYGKYNLDKLPNNSGNIDIIRISFYKKNLDEVFFAAEKVKTKGYKLFLQPSNIMEYSENEIIKLCKRANFTGANALYIVDSFGSMFPEDLAEIMPVFNETVNKDIELGFHSHNNIQLSFTLAIQFINFMSERNIIIDSSLCGLGRGAGNTKTELLIEYLNKRYEKEYNTDIIWECINKNILPLYEKYNWEYTPARGLKGLRGIHPDKEL